MALPLANPQTRRQNTCERSSAFTWRPPRTLHLWHLASLDAPTVAVTWAFAFAWVAGVHLDAWIQLLLASGTWTLYVGDRLLDSYRAISSEELCALRERHYFHWRHRRLLVPLACATAGIAAALVMGRMPVAARDRNAVLAAAALMYFSGVHSPARLPRWLRKLASKELLVGLLFTAGCAAPTLSRLRTVGWPFITCVAVFAALAWVNCFAIESWESHERYASVSLPTIVLGIACLTVSAALAFTDARASALVGCAGASALLLSLLDRTRDRISPLTLRTLADLVLLTPLVLLILGVRNR